ncbi:MAG: cytochrome c oxidase subunit II [Acidimicrobiales bacterium]
MDAFTNGSSPALTARLTSDADKPTQGSAPRRSRWVRTATGLAIAAPVLLAGCNMYPTYGADRGATSQGQDTFKLYSGMMTTGAIVGGLVGVLIIWTIFRYRRRSDVMPKQFHENIPIEILYTGIPIIIVAFLFFFTVITENKVTATVPVNARVTSTGTPVVNIKVTAYQWGWRFDYPRNNVSISGDVTNGPGNHGPQMVVPVGQTVQVTLVSNDVIHGFYVRDFNFSRYALPGVVNIFDLNLVRTGTFPGQCTQICGLYHTAMLFSVRAVTPAAFQSWAAGERAIGHTLQRQPQSAANTPPADTKITPSSALVAPSSKKGSL